MNNDYCSWLEVIYIAAKIKDLTNHRFGRLIAIEIDYETTAEKRKNNKNITNYYWKCKCDCGKFCAVQGYNLVRGTTTSCGCYQKEQLNIRCKKYNTYDLSGEYGTGYTFKNEKFFFDLNDYDIIKDFCWHINNKGYLIAKHNNKSILMHRMLLNIHDSKMHIDHKNGHRNDNRRNNLRIANEDGLNKNSINKKIQKNNTSGYPGIIWHKRDRVWEVCIGYNHKTIYLGRFDEFDDAVKCRKEAEKKYFGDWARKIEKEGD